MSTMTTAAVEMSEKQMLTLILEKLDRIELELSELRYPEEELIKGGLYRKRGESQQKSERREGKALLCRGI
ncbi:MAG: hypothetical protein QMD78_05615 [Methanocellales archaeon]|nr:hypothetical protein [Methanocellales archaeon]